MEDRGQAKIWTRSFILIALINLTTFIGFNMTTTGMPVYVSSLGASDFTVGLVTTLATGAALFVRPFAGLMLDRFGRKGILIVNIAAMAIVIAAYAVFPIVGMLLGLRVLHGVAWGLGSTASSTIAADVIPRQRFAEGMGYFALTSALAVAVAPALSIALLQNVGILPMIAIAAGSTVVSLVLAFFQKPAQTARPPEKLRLAPSDLFDRKAVLPAAMMLLINLAFSSITTFVALHGQAQGVDNIFLFFTVYAIVTLISRPIVGKIIDKTGFFIPGILSTLGVAITMVLIAFAGNIMAFCVAGIFAGLGIGTGMGTLQTMAVASVPTQRKGVATSTFLFGLDAGIALGALIAGSIAGAGGYSTMFLVMAIFPLLACVTFLVLGKRRIASYSITEQEG